MAVRPTSLGPSPAAAFEPPAPWHALPADAVVSALGVDPAVGLSDAEASDRRRLVGPNALPEPARRSLGAVLLGQFRSPLIYLLLAAAVVALALGHLGDAVVISVVVLVNAGIGAYQEGRAERSLRALRRLATQGARVLRGGAESLVEARDLVPGDLVLLEAGDAVPADARLLFGATVQAAEAALTGESVPVTKHEQALDPGALPADRANMLHAGTFVTAGRARAIVVATGSGTEVGKIAALAEAAPESKTPLERRVARFGRTLMFAAVGMLLAVLGIGLVHGLPFVEIFMVGVSQVVGMVPEGLPVAMTIALAVGVQRMARRRAVVRRLAAVETLGSTTVICSDKTGTLTRNEMTVTSLLLADGRELEVTGVGYSPAGELVEHGRVLEGDPDVRSLAEALVLCSDATLSPPAEEGGPWAPVGDPTEAALVTLALKAGLVPAELRARSPRRAELPFDPAAKIMATEHETAAGPRVVLKGAPEVVLGLAADAWHAGRAVPLDAGARASLEAAAARMGDRALRVLAVAVVDGGRVDPATGAGAFSGRATLLGLVGQMDPPRVEARDAVTRCVRAGIRPVMVTGDHKATGLAIAASLGIARAGDEAVDGAELARMSDAALAERIDRIRVFARVEPAQKLRIVDALQRRGEVVAMTGDGVNDAPALVKADVGVAMGMSGTEVAKESAKIVLGDDSFATLVAAVEEGRVVYRNIKKAVLLLFSTSAAEVLVLLLALVLGHGPPFAAVQILWNNLVSEGVITINLIMEPAEGDEMRSPPVARDEPLVSRTLLTRMAVMVPTITCVALGWFLVRTAEGVAPARVQTETFTLLVLCEWFNVLNCRSEARSALRQSPLRNPWLLGGLVVGNVLQIAVVYWRPLGEVFHTVPIGLREVLLLAAAASVVLWVEEARKLVARALRRRAGAPGDGRVRAGTGS